MKAIQLTPIIESRAIALKANRLFEMLNGPLMALFRPFKVGEFMSVTARKAEVIYEKSENPFSMSGLKGLAEVFSRYRKQPLMTQSGLVATPYLKSASEPKKKIKMYLPAPGAQGAGAHVFDLTSELRERIPLIEAAPQYTPHPSKQHILLEK